MADSIRIRNALMWRGYSELQATKLARQIAKNLDNYLVIHDTIEQRNRHIMEVYDNHTVSKPLRSPKLETLRANI